MVSRAVLPRPKAALTVVSMAQFLIALDYSIVYVALPSITRDLRFTPSVAPWIVSAYAVMFAGFLLLGGRLADRIGAVRLFTVAIALFGAASILGGIATGGVMLLAARAVQGIGAALLQPAILGVIGTAFDEGPSRSKAYAVWGAAGAVGLAAGVILGGVLTTTSWRLTFFIGVPVCALCAIGAMRWFPRACAAPGTRPIPLVASLLGTGSVLAVVLTLTYFADPNVRAAPALALAGLAALLGALFVANERRSPNVLIERALRRAHSVRTGALATALYMASVGAEFYLVTLLMQTAKGYSPLQAGFAFVPLAVMVALGSCAAGRAVRTIPATTVLCGGFLTAAIGLAWLALAAGGDNFVVDLLPGFVFSGFGHGAIYASMFMVGTRGVAGDQQSSAGAVLTTSQYIAGAIVVAGLTIVLGTHPAVSRFSVALWLTCAAALAGCIAFGARSVPRRAGSFCTRNGDTRADEFRVREGVDANGADVCA